MADEPAKDPNAIAIDAEQAGCLRTFTRQTLDPERPSTAKSLHQLFEFIQDGFELAERGLRGFGACCAQSGPPCGFEPNGLRCLTEA